MKGLKEIEASTQSVYQMNASQYDRERGKSLFEKKYLDLFLSHLPQSKIILDLGCGSGEPIARYLIERGCSITGTDYAESMLEICRERFPDHQWIFSDMRDLRLKESYDGILSWGAFFHLNQKQQRETLPKLWKLLNPKGIMMITVGHEEGEVQGTVAGKPVYHSSLSRDEYLTILSANGMELISFTLQDPDCQGFSVFLARKV